MSKIKIEIDDTRSKLCEGRHVGIGYALLKKIGEATYRMVQPLSPCKDYMNDVIYSELTGKPYGAWGLSTKKETILEDGFTFVSFSDCPSGNGAKAETFVSKEDNVIPKDQAHFLALMHEIESLLGVKHKTEIEMVDKNLAFAKIDLFWSSSTWAISLWSLLIRNAIYATGKGTYEDQLMATKDFEDKMRIKQLLPFLKKCIKDGFPKQDLTKQASGIHDEGIITLINKS